MWYSTATQPAARLLTPDAPLPVTLVRLVALATGACATQLEWTTASELRSIRYEVERSRDRLAFSTLGAVASRNSASGAHYAYSDLIPLAGTNYHRLRQVDQDGTSTYSPVTSLRLSCGELTSGLMLTLNPTAGPVRLGGCKPANACAYSAAMGAWYTAASPPVPPRNWTSAPGHRASTWCMCGRATARRLAPRNSFGSNGLFGSAFL